MSDTPPATTPDAPDTDSDEESVEEADRRNGEPGATEAD